MGMSPSSAWRNGGKNPVTTSSGPISHRVCTAAILSAPNQRDKAVRPALQSRRDVCDSRGYCQEACMKEVRKVHYVKGVFVCPKCRQSYVQEKWIESWRVRCHRCDYRGALTDVSVEERMEEETFRR